MNFKKILFFSLILFVLSVSVVSAADLNNTYVSESSDVGDSLVIGDSVVEYSEILTASAGSFADLQKEINNAPEGSVLNLTRNYNGQEDAIISINKDLTIDGQGHTIDCLKQCQAFTSDKGTITLKNLNIINGYVNNWMGDADGGAIVIGGTAQFTIDNCTFKDNYADDNGGVICKDSNQDLIIKNSLFLNNVADDYNGGVMKVDYGNLIIYNSIFENNHAIEEGGAILLGPEAYSLYINGCSFKSNRVENNAVFTYSNGGAIYAACKEFYIFNSTFIDNYAEDYGGAIYFRSNGYGTNNLFIDVNCSSSSSFINNWADDNNGGAIYSGGPVFADNTKFSRNYAYVDGGAVYSECNVNVKNCLFESNKASDAVSQCYGGAIRSNMDVTVENSTFKDNYAEDYGGAIYAKNVFVNRNAPVGEFSSFFINNKADDNKGGAIYTDDGSVTMVNTVLSGNNAKVDGGAVYSEYNVNVNNCLFNSNKADGASSQCYGGAIYAKNDAVINNNTFKDNYAHDYAGAVYANNIYVNNNQGAKESFNSFFIGNKAGDNDGGALYSYCDVCVKNAVFTGNQAYEDGGAIFCCDNAYITHCLFESNKADGAKSAQCEGGAIHCKDDLTVDNSTFNKNYAYDYGGAIYADTLALKGRSYFDSNTAYDNQGGAIWVNKFREDIKYATFTNNKAGEGDNDDGGAIYINNENWITFSQCVFVKNNCKDEGGAIYLDSSKSHLTLKNNIFVSNSAGDEGQTVYNCGKYDSINENWWSKNPSENNDQLIEWKPWPWSNVHHTDSNPLKLTFELTPDSCKVKDSVIATVSFVRPNGSPSGEMRTEYISFDPMLIVIFYNRVDHVNYVNMMVSPLELGTYDIFANLFGEIISKTLYVSDSSIDLNGDTTPDVSDNSGSAIANSVFVRNVYDGDALAANAFVGNVLDNNQTGNNVSVENNQSNSNVPVKSVSQSGNSNNLIYWALALVIIALCAIIVWRKMKN